MQETQRRHQSEIGIGGATLVAAQSETEFSSPSASSSSSIGKNSDCEEGFAGEEKEVQSAYRGKSLVNLGDLEQTLPHPDLQKGGLSKCYGGKAKSFSDLGKAESIANIREIEKKEHALNKRRRNQIVLERSCLKRPITSCRSALSLATTAASGFTIQDSNSASSNHSQHHHHHNNSYLPPLYPGPGSSTHHKLTSLPSPTPMRSFSMADLHYFSTAASTNYT